MVEIELVPEDLSNEDNTSYVEMSKADIWFLKHLLKKYNPKKIVEVGVSAGGTTVNLLNWKDDNAKLYSIDISTHWYQDETKSIGFFASEYEQQEDWKFFKGKDFLDVYKEIGDNIDFIIIDTRHAVPGEILTFIATLPQLKDGCIVVLHDLHLNMMYINEDIIDIYYNIASHCNALLFGGVSSHKKWTVKNDPMTNIGAFVVDDTTRENIKDVFHILTSTWEYFPDDLDLDAYDEYVKEHYSTETYNLYNNCMKLQSKLFNLNPKIEFSTDKK